MINDTERNKKMKEKDGCLGEYDYYGEFDCGYEFAGGIACEDCIHGPAPEYGVLLTKLYDPATGKRYK